MFPREPVEKYCFTYCGDDHCDCQKGPLGPAGQRSLAEFKEWFERKAALEEDLEVGAGWSVSDTSEASQIPGRTK